MWNCEKTSEFPGRNNYFCRPPAGSDFDALLLNINIDQWQPGSNTFDISTPMVATFSGRRPVHASVHVDKMLEAIATATSDTMGDNSELDCRQVDDVGYCKLMYKGRRVAVPSSRHTASCTVDNTGSGTTRCSVVSKDAAYVTDVTPHGQSNKVYSISTPIGSLDVPK